MSERLDPSISEMLSHASWVQDLARRLVHDPASADDLAQSTWVVALEHSREPRTNLRGWLAHTMKNLLRERARRESRRPSVERDAARGEELPSTESLVARADAQRALVEAVLALDEPHKTTLLLRYFEGLPPEAIAKREGVPVATVASRITRAHAKLREALAARGGDRTWLPVVAAILLRPSPTAHPLSKAILMSTSAKIIVPAAVVLLAAH
jgi:RNA polymerase sigma-70 factor (ECF subfamily)